MASPPPSYASSASVSRSKVSEAELGSLTDSLLRASLTRDNPSPRPPSMSSTSLSSSINPVSFRSSVTQTQSRPKSTVKAKAGSATHTTTSSSSHKANANNNPSSGYSAAEAKLRLQEVKQEFNRVNANSAARSTKGLFKSICSIDLLFLIDTTSSMGPYIQSARQQVRSILNDMSEAFLNESTIRVAVVGYKDHGDMPNIQFLDFTLSVDEVSRFLDTLLATGGWDTPEDVLGGIHKALNASWKQQTRCIIHIADAPAHGRDLHSLNENHDNYIEPGSEPHRLKYGPLLRQLIQLKINYTMLRITTLTDRMTMAFSEVYASFDGEHNLCPSNMYYSASNATRGKLSSNTYSAVNGKRGATTSTRLRFEELQLGTTYDALKNLVVQSVTSSVSRTANRLTTTLSSVGKIGRADGRMMKLAPELTVIAESQTNMDPSADVLLETTPPRWNKPGWLDKVLEAEGLCPEVVLHAQSTLNEMMAADDNIKLSVLKVVVRARSRPFAQGALRIASYARIGASVSPFVIKSYKKEGMSRSHTIEDMRIQALCKAFALEFNGLLKTEQPIDFVSTTCLQTQTRFGLANESQSLEPWIDGEYVKYNNNTMYVNEDSHDPMNLAAQAFSHFTFERSWGYLLVNDLQGVGRILTDPSIQTRDPERFKLADTNLHDAGMKAFFVAHQCNDFCQKLGLLTNKKMFATNEFQYRESWPTMEPTICCSSKYCRRIVRLAAARKSSEYPGCHWCDECWPQLESTMARWLCTAPGPNHEFKYSKFFYESQGQSDPRRCLDHRERDETVSTAEVVGSSLWSKLKSADQRSTVSGRVW